MSKIIHLLRSQIDTSTWDDFIRQSPQSIVYAYSWYLDVVSPHWEALIWQDNNQWQAVMPVPVEHKWGFKKVQQPFFCQFLGVFSLHGSTANMQQLIEVFKKKYGYISTYSFNPSMLVSGSTLSYSHCMYLDCDFRKNYTKDRLTNLKRAQAFGWQIQDSTDIEPLIDLFETNHAHQIDNGVSRHAYDLLRQIVKELLGRELATIRYAFKNDKIESGCLFAIENSTIIYLFNAASAIGRRGNARTLMIDSMMDQYKEQGFTFDFESPEVLPIANYYQSFGSKVVAYSNLRQTKLPLLFQVMQKVYHFLFFFKKRLDK